MTPHYACRGLCHAEQAVAKEDEATADAMKDLDEWKKAEDTLVAAKETMTSHGHQLDE